MDRKQMDAFWQQWLAANRAAEQSRDWSGLADFYAEDATYGWMYTPDEHFMAVGREQIRDWALGTEMAGLDGWHYDYVATMTDEQQQMVLGFWKQRAGMDDEDGREYEVLGIGGAWFGLQDGAAGPEIAWQRDWFELGAVAETFLAVAGSGRAPQGLLDRMALDGLSQPGHYRRADLPSTIWPPPVEAGDHVTQEAHR